MKIFLDGFAEGSETEFKIEFKEDDQVKASINLIKINGKEIIAAEIRNGSGEIIDISELITIAGNDLNDVFIEDGGESNLIRNKNNIIQTTGSKGIKLKFEIDPEIPVEEVTTVIVSGKEFEPLRQHGSIHTRLNMMDDKIGKVCEKFDNVNVNIEGLYNRIINDIIKRFSNAKKHPSEQ